MITASLSTIAWREPGLAVAIGSILPQVDRLNVFLQGYDRTPTCLDDPRVAIIRDTDAPESAALGASAKYHWLWSGEVADGHHVVIDDDIEYPPDYVQFCVRKIDEYGRRAVVGFHGAIYKERVERYFRDRQSWGFNRGCDTDRFVHMIGTGTTAHHTSAIRLTREDFAAPNSCDLFLGIACQRQRVPMVCLERPAGYLKALPLAADPRAASAPVEYERRMVELWRSWQQWTIHTCERASRPPPVVVVIPCYNEIAERIERTVASALATPGVDLVRVVDDGSNTPVALAGVEVIRLPANRGPSAALNAGIRSLPGDAIICRLDVGDVFYPEPKARQIAMVRAGARAVCSWRFDPVAGLDVPIRDGWERAIFRDCQFASTATVFRKSTWLEAGGFDDSIRWTDDWRFSAAVQAYVGWTAMHEVTGEHGEFPGGHSDVRGNDEKRRARARDRAKSVAYCRALGSPEKYAHLFDEGWCRKRGIVPMRKP